MTTISDTQIPIYFLIKDSIYIVIKNGLNLPIGSCYIRIGNQLCCLGTAAAEAYSQTEWPTRTIKILNKSDNFESLYNKLND